MTRKFRIPTVALIQHHPIWSKSYIEGYSILQMADLIIVPMWPWLGEEGVADLVRKELRIHWTGPIVPPDLRPSRKISPNTILVTAGSAKYDETLFTMAIQMAREMPEWTFWMHPSRSLGTRMPNVIEFPIEIGNSFLKRLSLCHVVLCGAGITVFESLMLGKFPIVLPVPYQREQEWTADKLHAMGLAYRIRHSTDVATLVNLAANAALCMGLQKSLDMPNGLDATCDLIRETVLNGRVS